MQTQTKAAFVKTLPVIASYLVLGFGFGVLMVSRGYPFYWAPLTSLMVYAGSMQYVLVDLLTGGVGLLSTAMMTLLINARHLFYGISMLEKYQHAGRKKPYLIFSLTDETYSLLCGQDPPEVADRYKYFFDVSAFGHFYWVLGSLIGALAGVALPWDFRGVEFSMTALFVVVFTEQWMTARDRLPAVIGLGSSLVCLLLFGPQQFILPAMGMILLLLTALRGYMMAGEAKT